jgi:phosphoglycerate dehydrogenase-like enzyme
VITRIVVYPHFDEVWPFAADHLLELLSAGADVRLERVDEGGAAAAGPDVERLFWLGAPLGEESLALFPKLREAHVTEGYRFSPSAAELLDGHGVRRLDHGSEGYWSQSVSEFALGLTVAGLRRVPQTYVAMLTDPAAWDYPTQQFGDDPSFANGTVSGKRVRIVGAGNVASRYASFVGALGADVAAWDPYASDPSFHRAGSRRVFSLEQLARDAEIFAPMVPLLPTTEGLVTADVIRALPRGCLVVLVTRAGIVDMTELRRRVLADELSLAADVFDVEPLPLDDPLLGRHNVVHTPHNAGRTMDSNLRWASMLAAQLDD